MDFTLRSETEVDYTDRPTLAIFDLTLLETITIAVAATGKAAIGQRRVPSAGVGVDLFAGTGRTG
jgi:hypothetical protein